MIERGNVRELEVEARIREQMSQLGPVVEAASERQNDPAIARTFAIAERAGILPDPPEELIGVPVKVDYISILAQAQKSQDIGQLDAWAQSAQAMQEISPRATLVFDGEAWMREKAEKLGVLPAVVNSPDEVKEAFAAMQRQQQMAQQAELAATGAAAIKDASDARIDDPGTAAGVMAERMGIGG
jgi:hypothetical protein